MAVTLVRAADCETNGSWRLVRRTLGVTAFGLNLVDIAPGQRIPEHDEVERDQEEVCYVVGGSPTLVVDGEDHAAPAGTFARLDPEHTRTVRNDGDQVATVLIASAPRTSGYTPLEWA